MNDSIKLPIDFIKWEWFDTPHMFHFFCYLLFKAKHQKTRYKGQILEPGQVIFNRKAASKDTGISQQSIRTCVKRLKSTNEISVEATPQGSVITVLFYAQYKASYGRPTNDQPTINQRSTNDQPAINQRSTNDQPTIKQQLPFQPYRLIQIWNQVMKDKGFGKVRAIGNGKHYENFVNSVKHLQTEMQWIELFDKVKESKFLCGDNPRKWRASLVWLLDYDNAVKVLNGDFSGHNSDSLTQLLKQTDKEYFNVNN